MIVAIDEEGAVSLDEHEDFSRFSVAAAGDVDVDRALRASGAGRLVEPPDSARIAVEWLRDARGAVEDDAAWDDGLEAMLRYAASKQWLDADGSIAAHVERRP